MPSTYSTSLKIELIANGEQSGTWGQTTNNNLGTLVEQAITGVGSVNLVGGDYVLTNYNGLADESRNAVLTFSGSLASPANVITPAVQKTYIITNNCGANVTIKTATGNGVTVSNGLSALVYCDGTNFYTAVNVNNVIGDLTVSGNEVIGGAVYLGNSAISGAAGNLTMTANASVIDMSPNTGAFIPPTGTTLNRPSSPTVGMSRWNTTAGVYEIWNGVDWQPIASGTYSLSALFVGGGGGASYIAGGGGGGLLYVGGIDATPGTSYTITVGAAGANSGNYNRGSAGGNSSGFTYTAVGGGGGGGSDPGSTTTGGSGGSGGGGGSLYGAGQAGGSGTSGQGYAGGTTVYSGAGTEGGGGGGAAGAGGANVPGYRGGDGGNGLQNSITGTPIYYSGGGYGIGTGYGEGAGTAGTGAGSSYYGGGGSPGVNSGAGVVIISYIYPTQRSSGGTVTSYTSGSNTYWVHTFTTSGTFIA